MHRAPVSGLLFLSILGLASCEPREAPTESTMIRDSAGIIIVENTREESGQGISWSFSAQPVWTIGSAEGGDGQDLLYVQGAVVLSDGRIALGNAGTSEVRIYSAAGGWLATFGGAGDGPGEFRDLSVAGVMPGDTIVAVDDDLRRITLVHPDEGPVRTAQVESRDGGHLYPTGLLGVDAVLTYSGFSFSNIPADELVDGYARPPITYAAHDLHGSFLMDYGPFPGPEFNLTVSGSGTGVGVRSTPIPFAKFPLGITRGDRILLHHGDTPEILEYSRDGQLARILREERPLLPVTADMTGGLLEARLARASGEGLRQRIQREFSEVSIPEHLPPFGNLYVDSSGHLWAEWYRFEGTKETRASVFDPDGRLLGHISLPAELRVLAIGEDYLLGLRRDAFDVEYVLKYRLERG